MAEPPPPSRAPIRVDFYLVGAGGMGRDPPHDEPAYSTGMSMHVCTCTYICTHEDALAGVLRRRERGHPINTVLRQRGQRWRRPPEGKGRIPRVRGVRPPRSSRPPTHLSHSTPVHTYSPPHPAGAAARSPRAPLVCRRTPGAPLPRRRRWQRQGRWRQRWLWWWRWRRRRWGHRRLRHGHTHAAPRVGVGRVRRPPRARWRGRWVGGRGDGACRRRPPDGCRPGREQVVPVSSPSPSLPASAAREEDCPLVGTARGRKRNARPIWSVGNKKTNERERGSHVGGTVFSRQRPSYAPLAATGDGRRPPAGGRGKSGGCPRRRRRRRTASWRRRGCPPARASGRPPAAQRPAANRPNPHRAWRIPPPPPTNAAKTRSNKNVEPLLFFSDQ